MSGEPAGRRSTFQVHPTRRCNLSCAHCYTSSGPDVRGELPVELLAQAVADAARLGYAQLAVSGGEPFLYGDLPELLAAGKRSGMTTSVVSNGTVLAPARLAAVVPHLDLLAISIDGPPAEHNLLRASSSAFERVLRHLPAVRDTGVPFGFVFTLTRFNADQLDWLVGFAAEQGAVGVHIHPLTDTGRAMTMLRGAEPDALELLAARAEGARLAAAYPGMLVSVDALTSDEIVRDPGLVPGADASVAELATFLIVDDAGNVLPLTHDIDPSFRFGSLWDAPLAAAGRRMGVKGGRADGPASGRHPGRHTSQRRCRQCVVPSRGPPFTFGPGRGLRGSRAASDRVASHGG